MKFPVPQRLSWPAGTLRSALGRRRSLAIATYDAYREALAWLHEQGLSYYCPARARVFKALAVFTTVIAGNASWTRQRRSAYPPAASGYSITDQLRGIIHADEKLAREDFLFIAVMVCLPITWRWWWMITPGRERNCPRGRFDRTDSAAISLYQLFGWQVPDYIHLPLALIHKALNFPSRIMRLRCRKASAPGTNRGTSISGSAGRSTRQDFSVEQILQSAVKNWRLTPCLSRQL